MRTPEFEAEVCKRNSASGGLIPKRTSGFVSAEQRRATLRLSAMAADVQATTEADLCQLWQELARGERSVIEELFSEQRCYLVLSCDADAPHPIEGRRLEILQAVLRGMPQTNVAIDFALAPSTIALNSKLGMESLGVPGKPSRAHPLLMLAAMAADGSSVTTAKSSCFAIDDRKFCVIGASRPDHHLTTILPQAELAVIRRLVEGYSYCEIAAARGTSRRTIANQITAVFRRLRVSGRNELMVRLLVDEGLIRLAPRNVVQQPSAPASSWVARHRTWAEARRSA